ncbi:MAG: serine/threonine-protein kinase [Polyangiaceae bacterium]
MNESATRTAESDARFLPPVREGQTVAGKYLVGSLLGLGGMGVVHAARDTSLDRRVALKVLLPRLVASKVAGERFLREARAATRITSEHVVKLLESDTLSDGTPLLVMEYLEGKDLRAVLREEGPLSPSQAVDYLLQALQAIAEGHTHGIVHRDVKPSNLFLTARADGTPLIKVLDFGIAKTRESDQPDDFSLTNSEDLQLGSPTYMPPEQFNNPRDVDARADIWALGVTLYELISGKQPFKGKSYVDLVSRVLNAPPERLETAGHLPDGLGSVITRCLEKDRNHRYANAAELAVALAPFGSADARLSLSRVTGLSRVRAPTPPPTVYDGTAGEATVPVASGPALAPLQSATFSEARAEPLKSKLNRKAVGLAVTGACAIVGLLLLLGRARETRHERANALTTPPTAATPLPVRTATTALAAQTNEVNTTVLEHEETRAIVPNEARPVKRVPHRLAATSARAVVPSTPSAVADAATQAGVPQGTPSAPAQSALIESLIQNRH